MTNLVISTHKLTEMAPLAIRFEIRAVSRVCPVLKNLKGYHNERAIPE
jgi:hypothetical protein